MAQFKFFMNSTPRVCFALVYSFRNTFSVKNTKKILIYMLSIEVFFVTFCDFFVIFEFNLSQEINIPTIPGKNVTSDNMYSLTQLQSHMQI